MIKLKIIKRKKGEMPWWLVLMVLAILFLAIMSFLTGGLIKKTVNTVTGVQDNTANQVQCMDLTNPDGFDQECLDKNKDNSDNDG